MKSNALGTIPDVITLKPSGNYRWIICALLFFATTINYIDRQVIGILARDLQSLFGWTEIDYGNIVAAFTAAYAIGLLVAGRLIDRFGTKVGYSLAIIIWSLAGIATSFARSVFTFSMARAFLGLGEAANFPSAIKTVAEWFPKRERALATGIFNAGSNVGAIVAPLTVPIIAITWGWQWAFILTGATGFLWLLFWIPLYNKPEKHSKLSSAELHYIQIDPPDPPVQKIPWIKLVPLRQTCAFAIGKFMTDPIWWFYLYWIPNYLRENHGFSLSNIGLPLIIIYLVADIGSIGGGWLSSSLIKRGRTVNTARKTTMLICALLVLPVFFIPFTTNLFLVVGIISIAAAAHQGWSANLFTLTSDMFPRQAVGSVVGVGGMAGAIGGTTLAILTGYLLDLDKSNYRIIFAIAGVTYLLALIIIHLLVPKLENIKYPDQIKVRPLSFESIIGFGFIGALLGTFAGWISGLLLNFSGINLINYMLIGAISGVLLGNITGNIVSASFSNGKRGK